MSQTAPQTMPLQLVELLTLVLEAHASSLSRLALKFGIESLVDFLENIDEERASATSPTIPAQVFGPEHPGTLNFPQGVVYQRLEGTVRECDLPAQLEFYVWAYPFYRALIEGPFPLDRRIADVDQVIAIATDSAKHWLKALPINATQLLAAEQVVSVPWVQFRAKALEKAGRRRLGAV